MLFYRENYRESPQVNAAFLRGLEQKHSQIDRLFAALLALEWVLGIVIATLVSPYAWREASTESNIHILSAVLLGASIAVFPIVLALLRPGKLSTRISIACAQLLFSALLIHLMCGRIEAHFHVFVSIALLAAYKDRTVFIPAAAITVFDQVLRGFLLPESLFGTTAVVTWRPFEHAAWVIFEIACLSFVVKSSLRQLLDLSRLQCSLENERDLLENRIAERTEELHNAKLFAENILHSLDARVCIVDQTGKIIFANESWGNFNQVTSGAECNLTAGGCYLRYCEEMTGVGGIHARSLAGGIRDILNGDAFSYVDEFPAHAEERKQWFHVSAKPIIIEGKDCASVVYVDVTEAKLARVRAASLAQLVLESPDEVYVLAKTDICIVEVNYGACGNLGFDREQLLGKTPAILLTSESFERMLTAIQPLVDRDEQTLEFELVHRRVDGTEYTCSWSVHCGMFEEREVFFAFARDMTERKRLEMQLRQAQKLESVGQLAAGLAHEINTPMQAIFGNVEFLQNSFAKLISLSDRLVELLDQNEVDWSEESKNLAHLRELYRYDYLRAQTPQALNEASDASKRVISIVRAMKIMSHPGTQEKVSTNLSELIENAATITRNRWKYVAETKFDFSADPILIDALPDELIQVFINLFVNAADAIAEKIGESPRRLGWIEITTRLEGDKAFVSFRDTGQGIPKAIVNRVFDPFFTTKDVGKGTGQGLAIAFDVITKKHQGTITAVSDEGIGTTIDIVLPRNGSRGTHAVIYPVQHASSTLLA